MSSQLIVDQIVTSDGVTRPSGLIPASGYYLGKTIFDRDTSSYSTASGSFVDLVTFGNYSGFSPNSILEFYYHIPCRNDTGGWGGCYIEPNISFDNGGTWLSLGTTGYDGGVMTYSSANTIHYYDNTIMLYPQRSSSYTVRIKFRYKVYDGTVTVNGSNDLNGRATGGTYLSGYEYTHFLHYTIKEYIPMA